MKRRSDSNKKYYRLNKWKRDYEPEETGVCIESDEEDIDQALWEANHLHELLNARVTEELCGEDPIQNGDAQIETENENAAQQNEEEDEELVNSGNVNICVGNSEAEDEEGESEDSVEGFEAFQSQSDSDSGYELEDVEEVVDEEELKQQKWDRLLVLFGRYHVQQRFQADLLKLIREDYNAEVPLDPRSLKRVNPEKVPIELCAKNCYYGHIGVARVLKHLLRGYKTEELEPDGVIFWLYVDGVTKFAAARVKGEFWPLLIRVDNIPLLEKDVGYVGIYYGETKPTSYRLLEKFVAEYRDLYENGLELEAGSNRRVRVTLGAVVGDAPARALVKGTRGHVHIHACERCTVTGTSTNHRTVYDALHVGIERDDQSFRTHRDKKHHLVKDNFFVDTPLFQCKLDMVMDFPLDPMHLYFLGVVKRLRKFVMGNANVTRAKGDPEMKKLSPQLAKKVSETHFLYGCYTPSEYGRKFNKLEGGLKAVEEKLFAECGGVVAFRSHMRANDERENCAKKRKPKRGDEGVDKELYELMCYVTVMTRIMCDPLAVRNEQKLNLLEKLVRNFAVKCELAFGPAFGVFNVHCLQHIVSDIRKHKRTIIRYSAFVAENAFRHLMNAILAMSNPLVQALNHVGRRMALEDSMFPKGAKALPPTVPDFPFSIKLMVGNTHKDVELYRCLKRQDFTLNCKKEQDSFSEAFVEGRVYPVRCLYFIVNRREKDVEKQQVRVIIQEPLDEELFDTPVRSSGMGIVMSQNERASRTIRVAQLRRKMLGLPLVTNARSCSVFFPILHTCQYEK